MGSGEYDFVWVIKTGAISYSHTEYRFACPEMAAKTGSTSVSGTITDIIDISAANLEFMTKLCSR